MRKSNLLLKVAQVASLATIATLNVSVSADPVAPATANELPQICNEWDFVKDSFTDGVYYSVTGGSKTEIYGMALRQKGDDVLVAFNTNVPLQGHKESASFTLALGDLILNFGGVKYGVHFAPNDANVTVNGVYANVSTMDITGKNSGFGNLGTHKSYVSGLTPKGSKVPSLGDVEYGDGYFDLAGNHDRGQVAIKTGVKVADITFLSGDELPNFAATFGGTVGQYTYGFKFVKVEGMVGDVTAHIFVECINDGVALKTTIAGSCKPLLGEGLTNLVATAGQEGVALSWQMEGDVASLNVWRAEMGAGGEYTNITKIADGLSGASSYVDAEAVAGVTYYYAVEQISFKAENKFSEVVSAIAQ